MTAQTRARHVGKTAAERRDYLDNITGRGLTPTLDAPQPQDSTTFIPDEAESRVEKVSGRKARPPSRGDQSSKWLKWLATTVALVLLGYISFLGVQLYSLNRELGEIRQDTKSLSERLREAKVAATERETRTDHDIERIQRQIDRIQAEKR